MVYAFEPAPLTFYILTKNTRQINNIVPINIALSNNSSIHKFYECENSVLSGLKDTKRANVKSTTNVITMKGDTLVESLKLQRLNFIKIDVEGFEQEVLEGLRESIMLYQPVIFCEIYGGLASNLNPDKTIEFLIDQNYHALLFKEGQLINFQKHSDKFHNYLFIPRNCYENLQFNI
jgi:FkbM family methyltransferase